MNRTKYIAITGCVCICVLLLFAILAIPKLPPDGTVRHTWQITAYTKSNTVWIASNGVAQKFFSDTAWPRRNFGEDSIKHHWFRRPTIEIVDVNGIRWEGKIVNFWKKGQEPKTDVFAPNPPKATTSETVYKVEDRSWRVTNGGDFNVLIDKLQERGFSNTVLQLEKNGHLFNVNIPDRTNATIIYIGKKL